MPVKARASILLDAHWNFRGLWTKMEEAGVKQGMQDHLILFRPDGREALRLREDGALFVDPAVLAEIADGWKPNVSDNRMDAVVAMTLLQTMRHFQEQAVRASCKHCAIGNVVIKVGDGWHHESRVSSDMKPCGASALHNEWQSKVYTKKAEDMSF